MGGHHPQIQGIRYGQPTGPFAKATIANRSHREHLIVTSDPKFVPPKDFSRRKSNLVFCCNLHFEPYLSSREGDFVLGSRGPISVALRA